MKSKLLLFCRRSFSAALALLISAALVYGTFGQAAVPASAEAAVADETFSALRLHIIANSDNARDQSLKLLVRDAVLDCVRERFSSAENAEEAKALLLELGGELLAAAEETLRLNGCSCPVQLLIGRFTFPDRTYGKKLYPAGEYDAMRIIIGNGEGHNWWCVMFPPLCIIDTGENTAKYNEDGTVEFRSFFAELWEKLFGRSEND